MSFQDFLASNPSFTRNIGNTSARSQVNNERITPEASDQVFVEWHNKRFSSSLLLKCLPTPRVHVWTQNNQMHDFPFATRAGAFKRRLLANASRNWFASIIWKFRSPKKFFLVGKSKLTGMRQFLQPNGAYEPLLILNKLTLPIKKT